MESDEQETVELRANESGWDYVGTIGIDTAKCWIGDPSYEVPHVADEPGLVPYLRIQRDHHVGRGVLVRTGFGDGSTPSTSERIAIRDAPSASSSTSV